MRTRTLFAPAKLNLSLRLRGLRADGYHLIDSVVVPIAVFDRLEVSIDATADGTKVTSDSSDAPSGECNLISRAAEAMRRCTGRSFGLTVLLRKQIPVGSGMGGGSSDAAETLKFLNLALGSPYDRSQLAAIGSTIGADVPFFVYGQPAIVRGVGERVQPVGMDLNVDLVVCSPGVHVSTAEVYALTDRLAPNQARLSLTIDCPERNIANFVAGQRPLAESLTNDLEEAAAQVCPEVRLLKSELLRLGAQGASMTGSGSAVFGVCSDAVSAERIAAALREKGLWARSTRAMGAPSPVGP